MQISIKRFCANILAIGHSAQGKWVPILHSFITVRYCRHYLRILHSEFPNRSHIQYVWQNRSLRLNPISPLGTTPFPLPSVLPLCQWLNWHVKGYENLLFGVTTPSPWSRKTEGNQVMVCSVKIVKGMSCFNITGLTQGLDNVGSFTAKVD